VALAASAGALGTLVVGAGLGMRASELRHLAILLIPAALATVVSTAAAGPLLARSSMRGRLAAIAVVAALVSLANLAVLERLMFVNDHDATAVSVLLVYSMGAGLGAALVLSRASSSAVDRLAETARALGRGELGARTGVLDAGPELDTLARTLDEMADRLQDAVDRERRAESTRRDLITAVSHDLRTPLADLRVMVEAIDDGVVEDLPSLRRYANQMRRAVDSLVLLVDDLFELSQLDAGAIEHEQERGRLDEVVRSAVAACHGQATQKGLTVSALLDGTENAPCSPRLVRVLQNLLQNAIRHTPADGTIRIEAHRSPAGLEVAVQDSGEGIAPGALDRIFEPFWRADPARGGGGAGLGLALAKRIVEALGGSIAVRSEPDHGARFELVLPTL
jgi:signal transduction histidine kinase